MYSASHSGVHLWKPIYYICYLATSTVAQVPQSTERAHVRLGRSDLPQEPKPPAVDVEQFQVQLIRETK